VARRRAAVVTTPVVLAVVRRPRLWGTALRQGGRLARRGWWRRPPFLPLPPSAYVRFRLETQYGRTDQRPDPDDVVRYLAWCKGYGALQT
jgi:hypothetical protein